MSNQWFFNYGEQAGKSHISRRIPCQDKALCRQENGVTVAAVSDGCGSSAISQYGSKVTAETLCDYFIENFDLIHGAEILESRKMIVDKIIASLLDFIGANEEIFRAYKAENLERYNDFVKKRSEEEFYLDSLNATALFAAVKDDKYIIGQIGDGVIGGVVRNQLKIIMEEKKEGEVNGTFYPANIYSLAQKNPDWYGCAQFQLKKPKNADVSAFILTTDGVDSFFDLRVPFQKKYTTGVDKLFQCTVGSSFAEAKAVLDEQFLPALVNGSRALDDCGVAVLAREDYFISQDGYVITKYERYEEKEPEEKEPEEKEPAERALPEEPEQPACAEEEEVGEDVREFQSLKERVFAFIGADAAIFMKNLEQISVSLSKKAEILRMYIAILEEISQQGFFVFDKSVHDEIVFGEIYRLDDRMTSQPTDLTAEKYNIYRE